MALHVEAKTGMLAVSLAKAGAKVRLASCNPLSTDDSVALALREEYGIETYAKKWESTEEYYHNLNAVLDLDPDFVIDDGADLITMLHTERPNQLPHVKGANEETTTGVIRLRAMAKEGKLKFPVDLRQRRPDEVPVRQPLRHGPVHLRRLDERHEPAGGRKKPGRRRLWMVRQRGGHAGQGTGRQRRRHRGQPDQGHRGQDGRLQRHADAGGSETGGHHHHRDGMQRHRHQGASGGHQGRVRARQHRSLRQRGLQAGSGIVWLQAGPGPGAGGPVRAAGEPQGLPHRRRTG